MNEGSFGVHQIEFVVQSGPSLGDGGGVTQHANCTLNLGQITSWNHGRRLVVDSNLAKAKQNVNGKIILSQTKTSTSRNIFFRRGGRIEKEGRAKEVFIFREP